MTRPVLTALLLSTFLSTPVFAEDNGAIDTIRLSSGGLAEVLRKVTSSGDGVVRIEVPLAQVDDVLKSLVVSGKSGAISRVSLAGPRPLEETYKGLPFTPESIASVPSLLASIQGAPVAVTSGGKTVEGQILGVQTKRNKDAADDYLLSVIGKDGQIETIRLGEDTNLSIEDTDLRKKLADVAAATGRAKNDGIRSIDVALTGAENQDISLSYVVAAPIWKTAYRVLIGENGKARLQGWAILENASGEDWKGIKIALTSADPVTLKQRLHQLYWKDRAEVAIDTATNNAVMPDTGNLAARIAKQSSPKAMLNSRGVADSLASMPNQPAPVAAEYEEALPMGSGDDGAVGTENDMSATFDLPGTYDLANGDTLSVPIADAQIDAQMVSVYRAGSRLHNPVAAIMLANSTGTSMPGGIITVYDARAGYVGDAQLLGLPKGDTRLASFATDRKVTITEDQSPTQQLVDIKVLDGIAETVTRLRETTTYTVSGALDGERNIIIEHPVRNGWTFKSDAADGKTASHQRLKAVVGAGQEKTVTAIDEQLQSNSYQLIDADPDVLLGWSSSARDKATAEKFARLAEIRKKQIDAQTALQELDENLQRLTGEQERIRQNIAAVPENSDLKTKYLKALEDSEDGIEKLAEERTGRKKEVDFLESQSRDLIRQF